jgi:hypothetical protein
MTWMHILHFDVLNLAVWPSRFSAMNSTPADSRTARTDANQAHALCNRSFQISQRPSCGTPTWPARSACDQPIRWRPAFGGQDYRAASWGHLAWTTFASPETISLNPSREFPMASADIGRMTMSPWRSRMKSSRDILSRSPMAASRRLWPDFRADLPRTQRDGSGRSVAREGALGRYRTEPKQPRRAGDGRPRARTGANWISRSPVLY